MNSKFIILEDDQIIFTSVNKMRVRIKLSDITSLADCSSGRWIPIISAAIFDAILVIFFWAMREDSINNNKEVSYIALYLALAITVFFLMLFLKGTSSERLLLIGSKGSPFYKVDCFDENLQNLIIDIEKAKKSNERIARKENI